MGLKDSKLFPILYEDAVKRVREDELTKLSEAFRRHSNRSGSLSRSLFAREVFADMLPPPITDLLYCKFGGTSKGIAFKELLCGLVLISRCTKAEKIKFLFAAYSNDPYQSVGKDEMEEIVLKTERVIPSQLSTLFEENDHVTLEVFSDWMLTHSSCLSISHWLLNESPSLSSPHASSSSSSSSLTSLSPPSSSPSSLAIISDNTFLSFYQILAGVTHLDEAEIVELERQHGFLKQQSSSPLFDLPFFLSLTHPPLSTHTASAMFRAFDENNDNNIDLKELACGISACCRGPQADQLKFCFKLFDRRRTGFLDEDDSLQMLRELLGREATDEEMVEMMTSLREKVKGGMQSCGKDGWRDGSNGRGQDGLSQEDFIFWALEKNCVHNFLNLLVQVCHISLGLKPLSRQEESSFIVPWLTREEKEGLCEGQVVYLVASDWWKNWIEYIQMCKDVSCGSVTSSSNSTSVNSTPTTPSPTPPPTHKVMSLQSSKKSSGGLVTLVGYHKHSKSFSTSPLTFNPFIDASTTPFSSLPRSKKHLKTSTLPPPTKTIYTINSPYSPTLPTISPPPPVDNSSLVGPSPKVVSLTDEGAHVRSGVLRGVDYEAVQGSTWRALCQWYGAPLVTLARTVIRTSKGLHIEVHPVILRLFRHRPVLCQQPSPSFTTSFAMGVTAPSIDLTTAAADKQLEKYLAFTAAFSCKQSLAGIQEALASKLRVIREDIRLWDISDEMRMMLLDESEKSLDELSITNNHAILVEVRSKDLTWPEEMMQLTTTKKLIHKSHTEKGAAGLNNLGNTCFMNSALQCLSNTHPLTEYFVRGLHLRELNRKNPLGANGHLAERYGELVRQLWSGQAKSIAPLKLKLTINKYASCFNDLQQHDSQELLAFLLDGLHEDLNRVHNKPYVELKDSDGRPDDVVALEAWENHCLRNQSIVVDLFLGQLKSCVWCCHCGHKSVKFDPFTFLSLPLPFETTIHLEVTVVRIDGSLPIRYGCSFQNDDYVHNLRSSLSTLISLPPHFLVITEVAGPFIKSFPQDNSKLRLLSNSCLVAYVMPHKFPDTSNESSFSPISFSLLPISSSPPSPISSSSPPSPISSSSPPISSSSPPSISSPPPISSSSPPLTYLLSSSSPSSFLSSSPSPISSSSPPLTFLVSSSPTPISSSLPSPTLSNGVVRVNGYMNPNANDNDGEDERSNNGLDINNNNSNTTTCSRIVILTSDQKPSSSSSLPLFAMATNDINKFQDNNNGLCNNLTTPPHNNCNNNIYSISAPHTDVNEKFNCSINNQINASNGSFYTHNNKKNCNNNINTNNYSTNSCNSNNNNFSTCDASSQPIVVIAYHREMAPSDTYYMAFQRLRASLFGRPIILPLPFQLANHNLLYRLLWQEVSRLVSPLPSKDNHAPNHAHDCDDSLKYRYPFQLRYVDQSGMHCSVCPWFKFCRGCPIESFNNNSYSSNDYYFNYGCSNNDIYNHSVIQNSVSNINNTITNKNPNNNKNTTTSNNNTNNIVTNITNNKHVYIAIDWEATALHLRYHSSQEKAVIQHSSVEETRRLASQPISLDTCLKAFTKEECLGDKELYYCGKCKRHRNACKKLDLCSLPPILIMHLKRFQCIKGTWVKSNKVVKLPMHNFDPSHYFVQLPNTTVKTTTSNSITTNSATTFANATTDTTNNTSNDPTITSTTSTDATLTSTTNVTTSTTTTTTTLNITSACITNATDAIVPTTTKDIITSTNNITATATTTNNTITTKIHNTFPANATYTPPPKDNTTTILDSNNPETLPRSPLRNQQQNSTENQTTKKITMTQTSSSPLPPSSLSSSSLPSSAFPSPATTSHFNNHLATSNSNHNILYDLYAVSNHMGSLGCGHYISYAKNPNGRWYCYNDSSCKEVTEEQVNTDTAYMLFYSRKDLCVEPFLNHIDGGGSGSCGEGGESDEEMDKDIKKMCLLQ